MKYQKYGRELEIDEDEGDTGSSMSMDEYNGVEQCKK